MGGLFLFAYTPSGCIEMQIICRILLRGALENAVPLLFP